MKFDSNEYFKQRIMVCIEILERLKGCKLLDMDNGIKSSVATAMLSDDNEVVKAKFKELAQLIENLRDEEN